MPLYSWLSAGIAIANKESFKKFLDPDHDTDPGTLDRDGDRDCHQDLIDFFLGPRHAPPKKISSKCVHNFYRTMHSAIGMLYVCTSVRPSVCVVEVLWSYNNYVGLPLSNYTLRVFAPRLAAPHPAEGAYSVPQNLLAESEGSTSRRRREKEKRSERIGERKRKDRERKSRMRDGRGAGSFLGLDSWGVSSSGRGVRPGSNNRQTP